MSLPLLLSAKCVSVTGGQDRRMFPCISCFPSFCSPLFKPLRGKPHSPSLNSTLSTPVDRQSTGKYPRGATFFLLLFFKIFFSSLLISTGIQNCSRVAVLVPEMSCMRNMVSASLFFPILPLSASTAAHAELQLEIVSVHGALWSMMIQ